LAKARVEADSGRREDKVEEDVVEEEVDEETEEDVVEEEVDEETAKPRAAVDAAVAKQMGVVARQRAKATRCRRSS
jgi:hypothetical protein